MKEEDNKEEVGGRMLAACFANGGDHRLCYIRNQKSESKGI